VWDRNGEEFNVELREAGNGAGSKRGEGLRMGERAEEVEVDRLKCY
jgi:hypothetical protein